MNRRLRALHPRNWLELSSPVTLGFAGLSLLALLLAWFTSGASNRALFMVYRSSPASALFYLRLFLHVLGHASFAHYAANMALLLVLGPLVEQQFGGLRLAIMMLVTALVTGLVHLLLSPGAAVLGASGIVFMLILLSAAAGRQRGKIPLTLLLVALIYLGQELASLFRADQVSQLAHLIGGLCGLAFGLASQPRRA
ncbi:MAG: rhomboid family intramembrane serine protease [Clostridiales bacterium]|mgnify:CR=1 FL=1|nr:rhomboid family intramembrane serine protease [Clostridiales bacterium]